ncbi:hypothetical protein [Deinococcus sp. YIM 77859]|uniref:hypothetical protein n=1 Tax=Deinococcus sp. YIM 77859 TaxID=1540221 RepID=UPI000B31234F|nr:hypothetical protein [Deinococcus sp. YIM 77859]
MISVEGQMYGAAAGQPGGWRDFKPFRVVRKVQESRVIASLVLEPVDGQPLPPFRPGQYLSLKVQGRAKAPSRSGGTASRTRRTAARTASAS